MNPLIRSIAAGVLGLALAVSSWAAQPDAVQMLRQFVQSTQTVSGQFEQTLTAKEGGATEPPSRGSFVFERPGRFSWQVRQPYAQSIVSDGSTLWLFDQDLNQVTVKKVSSESGGTPLSVLFGRGDIESGFSLEPLGAERALLWVRATPRQHDVSFQSIDIGFSGQGELQSFLIHDHFGQTTQLRLTQLRRNEPVSPSVFRFAVPEGADVLRDESGIF